VGGLGSFLALLSDDAALTALAEEAVRRFEPLRAPLSEADLARRNVGALDERERELLASWGYPYVMDRFRFHMTLTGSLPPGAAAPVAAAARAHFGPLLARPQRLVPAVFAEAAPDSPFRVLAGGSP
jgi:hypothetical protein